MFETCFGGAGSRGLVLFVALPVLGCTGSEDTGIDAVGLEAGASTRWLPTWPPTADSRALGPECFSVGDFSGDGEPPSAVPVMLVFNLRVPDCWPCDHLDEDSETTSLELYAFVSECEWDGEPADRVPPPLVQNAEEFTDGLPTAAWSAPTPRRPGGVAVTLVSAGSDDGGDPYTYLCEFNRGSMTCDSQVYESVAEAVEPTVDCDSIEDLLEE